MAVVGELAKADAAQPELAIQRARPAAAAAPSVGRVLYLAARLLTRCEVLAIVGALLVGVLGSARRPRLGGSPAAASSGRPPGSELRSASGAPRPSGLPRLGSGRLGLPPRLGALASARRGSSGSASLGSGSASARPQPPARRSAASRRGGLGRFGGGCRLLLLVGALGRVVGLGVVALGPALRVNGMPSAASSSKASSSVSRGRRDRDVEAPHLVDRVVVDLREDDLLPDAERVVAAAVERARVQAAEVADPGDRDRVRRSRNS